MITKRNDEMDAIRTGERRTAVFSDCRAYRFTLEIVWESTLPVLQVIGLNPSTADEMRDDPTVAKLKRMAKRWGFGSLVMTNLFAFRATDPEVMMRQESPEGGENCDIIAEIGMRAKVILCCWGNHGRHRDRATRIEWFLTGKMLGEKLHCLRITKTGQPEHPLYLPESLPLIPLP